MVTETITIQQLAQQAQVLPRTLRSWIRQGLLAKPSGRGRAARYDGRHLLRAKVIRHLRQELSLRDTRKRMQGLTDAQLRALLPVSSQALPAEEAPAPAVALPSLPCEIIHLMDGITLIIEPERGPGVRRIAEQIYQHYAMLPQRS
jgi:DNA-binding transcriptional MerR regulator